MHYFLRKRILQISGHSVLQHGELHLHKNSFLYELPFHELTTIYIYIIIFINVVAIMNHRLEAAMLKADYIILNL